VRLAQLHGRRVALLGLGADVRAAVPSVVAAGPTELLVVEEGERAVALDDLAPDFTGPDLTGIARMVSLDEAASAAEVFVRSPGFPRYQRPLAAALARGADMTTPLDLWMGSSGRHRSDGSSRTVVAVTGTKGKSTVTELVGVLARAHGVRVGLAGNLGVPVFAGDGWDHDAPVVVLEVSSYQAADLHHVPDIAVLTFLAEDHLSWHGGVDRYVADKVRVLVNEGGTAGRVLLPASGGRAAAAAGALGVPAEVVEPPARGGEVPAHRLQNAALAVAILAAIGGPSLGPDEVVEAARTSLPGRLDPCPGPEGILCLDDALASNPSATAAGLAWLRTVGRPTVVLLGGVDRGVDPRPLVGEVARWPAGLLSVVALPDSGQAMAATCDLPLVGVASDVGDAVRRGLGALGAGGATRRAALVDPSTCKGVLLFSPSAPTPPDTGNWATRSAAFRAALAGAGPAVGT
jgi:UDP-N-acetylmuramoylalanine--D-glutamate ligase